MAGKSPQRHIQTRHDPRHATETPKSISIQPFIHLFSHSCWELKVWRGRGKSKVWEGQKTLQSHTTDDRMMEKYTEGHIFTTEKVVWSKRTVVSREADGGTEVKAEMCREDKQHLFPIETQKVSTLPYLDRGHGTQSVQWRSRCHCAVYLFSPPQGRWQGRGSWRVKGQRPRVADIQTHQKTSSVLQTDSVGNMYVFMCKIKNVTGCCWEKNT